MPYEDHPQLDTPGDDTVLWRYMDFTKFAALLEDAALCFSGLEAFDDPLEGYLTRPTLGTFRPVEEGLSAEEAARRKEVREHNLRSLKLFRGHLRVSCWHASPHESAAMWRLYLKSDEGIAVRTTISRFKQALVPATDPVHIARVRYVDYDADEVDWTNVLFLALHKRMSFSHEREVRALLTDWAGKLHRLVPVNLDALLESVFVSPKSQPWLASLVERTLRRHGRSVPVVRSRLEDGPLY